MASPLASSKSFGSNFDLVMEGWEVKENHDGVVYFVNSQRKITSWIHPYINKVFEELGIYNDVKYAAYRTALKLRFLQVKLGFNWISVNSIKTVFSKMSLSDDNSDLEDALSCREIFGVVHDVLELSDCLHLHRNELFQASEIILNLLLELFDTARSGKLAKRSVRIALVTLCSAKLCDKYRFYFNEITNDHGIIQREKFLYLIYDLMQITELLKESTAFGTNVSAAVNSCLKSNNNNHSIVTENESSQDMFYSWLLQEPVSIIWLPTLHRVIATENIRHNIQCSVCSTNPMIGFRYRCMQCFSYDLCQSCFFKGLISQRHRLKHPMQEYCFPSTRKDNTKALLKIMRNKMSKRHRRSKIKFLPVDDDSITGSVFQWQPRSLIPDPRDSFHSSTDSGLAVGSSDNVEYQVIGSCDRIDYANDDIAMMKKWYKPLEVLGEPCNTSSPYVNQETLSKKNMENQQLNMAQTIQQLQEENRLLRQKLSAVRKRELETEDTHPKREDIVTPDTLDDENQSGDPLKEITTDDPISPIKPARKTGGQNKTVDAFVVDSDSQSEDKREIYVNVLEIVGGCTPIPSSFCLEKKINPAESNESGISDDDTGKSSCSTSMKAVYFDQIQVEMHSLLKGQKDGLYNDGLYNDLEMEKMEILHHEPSTSNQLVFCAPQYFVDTETESTTSNDLEYTYSDMSLKSEATSRSRSSKSDVRELNLRPADSKTDSIKVVRDVTDGGQKTDPNVIASNFTNVSDYSSPNTTRNETTELDAFKLCRMKFNRINELPRKLDGHDVSHCQPHLIYSSIGTQNKTNGDCHQDEEFDSYRARKVVICNENNTSSQLYNLTNYPSFDLSEIPPQGSTASLSNIPTLDLASQPPEAGRKKTLEPVFMSTPVVDKFDRLPCKSALKKKSASAKVTTKQKKEKENRSPLCRVGSDENSNSFVTAESMLHFRKESSLFGVTPKSSFQPGPRQRILLSKDRLQSNRSYSCNDLTLNLDGETGMTTLFDKAEHHRTVGAGCQSLALTDKEELERMLEKVRIGQSQCLDLPPCVDVSNSSMLQAVMNVGDAMADFVHATAEMQMKDENTYL